jgi:hypothetical protein
MLTWSRGIRAAAGLGETEQTDEEIVEGETGDETLVAVVAGSDWDDVRDRPNAKLKLLWAAEGGGAEAVRSTLVVLLGREPSLPALVHDFPAISGVG